MEDLEDYFSPPYGLRKGFDKIEYRETKGPVRKKKLNFTRRNIDYSPEQYELLQEAARKMGVPSQALAKIAIQQFLDRFAMAEKSRNEKQTKKAANASD